ncbi:hypothetical protein EDD11_007455 [Mortierella claussenii]|nr:hypothetical protein EDD11_007455 [Mortierella claussenii]
MDYDTIEAMVDAPFQKDQHQSSLPLDMDTSRRNSKRYTVVSEYLQSTLILRAATQGRRAIMRDHTQLQRNADTQGKEMKDNQEVDAIVTQGLVPHAIQEIEITESITGIIGTVENTGITESIETGTTANIGKAAVITVIDMRETTAEAILASAACAEAEVQRDMGRIHRRRRSPSPPADEATCDRRTVFVMQLSARLRSSELESFFSQAGKVRAARIIEDRNTGRSKGVGYVEFYDEDSVAKAIELTGQKLLGIPVIAKHTESEKNRLALQAASQAQAAAAESPIPTTPLDLSQHRLYVGSVNFDLTEDDLKQVLEPFGPIEFIKLHRDAETGKSKGFAFVQYKNADDAKQAMDRMNGYVLAGRTIKVGLVTEKGATTQNNSYQHNNSNGQINNSISIDDSDTAGYAMTSQSRAELMQKLARGDASLGAVPTTAASVATPAATPTSFLQLPVVMPSRAVLLKNMFTDEDKLEQDWAAGLEEDVKEEAEKSGPVVHVHVEQDSPGEIYLKFDSVQSATNAVQTLGGRFFAGRQIVAAFLPEMLYNVRFPRAANL